jgi:hypothetical protein
MVTFAICQNEICKKAKKVRMGGKSCKTAQCIVVVTQKNVIVSGLFGGIVTVADIILKARSGFDIQMQYNLPF